MLFIAYRGGRYLPSDILVDADYNDLGFSIGGRLVILVESQSTWTLNIIIRALLYLIQTYHDYFKRTKQNLYGSKKVNMPKPELYVIFTGEKPENPPDVISLSKDFFDGEKIAIDAEVKVLYREDESNIIGEYIIFWKISRLASESWREIRVCFCRHFHIRISVHPSRSVYQMEDRIQPLIQIYYMGDISHLI